LKSNPKIRIRSTLLCTLVDYKLSNEKGFHMKNWDDDLYIYRDGIGLRFVEHRHIYIIKLRLLITITTDREEMI
jgi:hypothetical protein